MERRVVFLLDTNIWLERLLDQDRAHEVKLLLESIPTEYLYISDFSLHSIGVIVFKAKFPQLFYEFVEDLFGRGDLRVLSLNPFEQIDLLELHQKLKIDFDDAYQYQVAEKYGLNLITFDKDFKKGKLKVFTPLKAIELFKR